MEADGAKQAFLREFGADYGYPDSATTVDNLRATQFNRLQGTVYLDHAGATLYSEAQMEAVVRDLTSSVYGNPHSQSDSSLATSDMIQAAREQVLDYCNASSKDYRCIFTSGATAALKLVGEAFPWSRESCYMYTMENHNSVLGIREYALEKGARAHAVDIRISEQSSEHPTASEFSVESSVCIEQRRTKFMSSEGSVDGNTFNLFAFPSECNFSGIKYHLELVNLVKKDMKGILGSSSGSQHISKGCWMVLIDAAKGCATQPPDLSKYPADFVVLSFYKIFGYPTGLGALIVRNEAAKLLKPTYFSGGTVSASIADIDFVKRRENIEQMFEDGTQSFLSIVSVRHGFRIINMLTTSAIARHTSCLATYVRNILADLKHENGALLCKIYGSPRGKVTSLHMGPTISFNLRRPNGSWFGYREVENLASLSGIQLRTGCFCNPGACAKYLSLSHSELLSNIEAGHVCWDDHDIINGKPTGAVRISFGYMSTFEDAESFLRFMKSSFLSKSTSVRLRTAMQSLSVCTQSLLSGPLLKTIMVYPIKSCAGFGVDSWPLCQTGLLYDREWLLKGANGEVLTQKKVPEMGKIRTYIDIKHQQLLLESASCPDNLSIPLLPSTSYEVFSEELDLYGERYEVQGYSDDINMWFTKAVGRHCSLVRCSSSGYQYCKQNGSGRNFCRDEKGRLSFVNEAQLLLISEDSVSELNVRIESDKKTKQSQLVKPIFVDSLRFRPNLVISGAEPYAEDQWRTLNIGRAHFTSLGGCNRCQMINLDPLNVHVQKSKEPLATLASFRRVEGRILFGILLRYEEQMSLGRSEDDACKEIWLEVGQEVFISNDQRKV